MDITDLRDVLTDFGPQSAYDVLRSLCDQVGARSVRDALIQIQADQVVEESHVQDEDPRPYNGTVINPPTIEEAMLRPIDKDAELWAINRELVEAGLKPWQYESFAACVAELQRRSSQAGWVYCPYCGELMKDHLITDRGGACKTADAE